MCYRKSFHAWKKHHHPDHHGWHGTRGRRHKSDQPKSEWNYPPVNVRELDDRYELFLYAAGYEKSDFELLVNDNTLVIRVNKQEDEMEVFHWRRYEFRPTKFERRFELDERIDKEAIRATYAEGVLEVTIPKASGFETTRQEISVD